MRCKIIGTRSRCDVIYLYCNSRVFVFRFRFNYKSVCSRAGTVAVRDKSSPPRSPDRFARVRYHTSRAARACNWQYQLVRSNAFGHFSIGARAWDVCVRVWFKINHYYAACREPRVFKFLFLIDFCFFFFFLIDGNIVFGPAAVRRLGIETTFRLESRVLPIFFRLIALVYLYYIPIDTYNYNTSYRRTRIFRDRFHPTGSFYVSSKVA